MQNILILVSLLCFNFGISQEPPGTFSLEDAITYALENNRQVKNAIHDIAAAKAEKRETRATGLPQINGNIDYQNFFKQQVQVIPSDFSDANSELVPVVFGTSQNVNASASLSQLIFDGSYIVGLNASKAFLEYSENAKIKTDYDVRKAVINAYGNVLLTEESISVINKNIKVLEENLEDITKMYNNGLEEEESMEQLQITLTSIKSNLNNTIRLKAIAYQMLNITLGLPLEHPTKVSDNLKTLTNTYIESTIVDLPNNVKNTVTYKIADNNKVSKELLVRLEQSKALPSLSVFLTGGYNSFGNDFTFFNNDQDYFGYAVFGASLNIPIFSSGFRSARTQRAKIDLEIAENNLIDTEQRVKLEILTAKSNFRFTVEDYQNKQKNLLLASRIETKNETKFFEGIASSFDLRQAQTQLYRAQQELLQAMLDVINSNAELEAVLNTPINN